MIHIPSTSICVNRKPIKSSLLSAFLFVMSSVNGKPIFLFPRWRSGAQMETSALPVSTVQLPLRFSSANSCGDCVQTGRSDVPCPVWKSNQTGDLLLQAEKKRHLPRKAFVPLVELILHPWRREWAPNEYRGAFSTPSNINHRFKYSRRII